MSLNSRIKQNCPYCNTEQEMEYYRSVNVTLQPELKNKVLSGKLNKNICINCKKEINIVAGFLYHDMENQLMLELALADDGDDEDKEGMMNELKSQGYIYRKVQEYPQLIEKIRIFDSKLNDLVVQKISDELKRMLELSLKEVKGEGYNVNVLFNKIENGLFKKKICFYFFTHPSQMMEMEYDIKKLDPNEKKNLYDLEMLRK